MSKILIIYSSVDGHTRQICQQMQQTIEQQGHEVALISMENQNNISLSSFDKVLIGASIRYGKHRQNVAEFIMENKEVLELMPSAFFTTNLVARKAEKNQPETNPYIKKLLTQLNWKPDLQGVFAGKIDYQKYRFLDKHMIRFIMWMTKGPTDLSTCIDYTDWAKVDEFATEFGSL